MLVSLEICEEVFWTIVAIASLSFSRWTSKQVRLTCTICHVASCKHHMDQVQGVNTCVAKVFFLLFISRNPDAELVIVLAPSRHLTGQVGHVATSMYVEVKANPIKFMLVILWGGVLQKGSVYDQEHACAPCYRIITG